jgi:hypothetical protein
LHVIPGPESIVQWIDSRFLFPRPAMAEHAMPRWHGKPAPVSSLLQETALHVSRREELQSPRTEPFLDDIQASRFYNRQPRVTMPMLQSDSETAGSGIKTRGTIVAHTRHRHGKVNNQPHTLHTLWGHERLKRPVKGHPSPAPDSCYMTATPTKVSG